MTIREISGESSNDSGGGDMTIYALTANESDVPNVDEAIKLATFGGYVWYRINEVKRVGELPSPWEEDQETTIHLDKFARDVEALESGINA